MKRIIQLIGLIAVVFTVNTALAKGGKPPPAPEPGLLNVVTVSPQYGDYTSPVDAINSITNAAEDNQYVIQIGPGVYDIGDAPIIMKKWVKIEGAGRSFTVIRGSRANDLPDNGAAMVIGADYSALMRVGIENTGDVYSNYSIGILNDGVSPAIKHVKVKVTGSQYNEGISNKNSSEPAIENVRVIVPGTGVIVENSLPFIIDSYLAGNPGLKLIDSPGSRAVNNMIIGGVDVVGVLLSVTPTSSSVCRGNYDENLQDVYCPSTL